MNAYKYLNPYSDDLIRCGPMFITAEGNSLKVQDEILLKIQKTERKLADEIQRTLPMFKPNGDYSVYTGYCGIALLYFQKFLRTKDQTLMLKALKLSQNAVENLKNRRISFLNGDSGPLALAIVLHKLNGEEKVSDLLIKRLLEMNIKSHLHPDEILYGRAGYLYSLLFVDKYYGPVIPVEVYRKVIHYIIKSGWKRSKALNLDVPISYEWHEKNYFGAAHGLAGILYVLLCAYDMLSDDEKNTIILPTLKWLIQQKYPTGNYLSSQGSNKDRLVQWCHGAPGFVHLFLQAYKVYEDRSFLQEAIEAGNVIWERGILAKGYSICHGVSGNGYCFLALYKATKDPSYLYKAACFADWCSQYPKHEGLKPDRPHSLYEGIAGISCFLYEIQDPLNSTFPGYEI